MAYTQTKSALMCYASRLIDEIDDQLDGLNEEEMTAVITRLRGVNSLIGNKRKLNHLIKEVGTDGMAKIRRLAEHA